MQLQHEDKHDYHLLKTEYEDRNSDHTSGAKTFSSCCYYYCEFSPTPSQTPKGIYEPYNMLSELIKKKKVN